MNTEKKRILIIDDEAGFTRILKLNLEHSGEYSVWIENQAQRALSTAMRFKPDVVFLDVMMPNLDGGEVADQFHHHAALRSIPIVFLTAAVRRKEVAEHHGRIGGDQFLAKPVDITEVIQCIERNLQTAVQMPAHE